MLTRTKQRQVQSPPQTVNDGDASLSSESGYEEVDPPRLLAQGWRDLWSQQEFTRQQSQVPDEVQVTSPARNLAEVDLSLETVDIPDAHLPPIADLDADREGSRCK